MKEKLKDELVGYLHCAHCSCGELTAGLTEGGDVRLNCSRCNREVKTLRLKEPIVGKRCSVCGEPLGPEHRH